jgi:hypothetical protein
MSDLLAASVEGYRNNRPGGVKAARERAEAVRRAVLFPAAERLGEAEPALPPAWLWQGYLAAGAVTLLTSQWKSGKTTLLSVLLARMAAGGEVAGRAVAAARAVVVTEESRRLWALRSQKLGLREHVWWMWRPFVGPPNQAEWLTLIDHLDQTRQRHGVGLAVIDPLAFFLPADENSARRMNQVLSGVRWLADRGLAVLLLHHPRKDQGLAGQGFRGSGALGGLTDVLIEMDWFHRAIPDDRRRRLRAYSRYDDTPTSLVIALNDAGTDYQEAADLPPDQSDGARELLHLILKDAGRPLTRHEIRLAWPLDADPPGSTSLWRWLEHAVARGRLTRTGTGTRDEPFRYTVAVPEPAPPA